MGAGSTTCWSGRSSAAATGGAAAAKKAGADVVLVVVPYYVRPSQEGLYRYFRTVAESVDLPVILYNIPGRTAVNLEASTIVRLARDVRNIVGVKEANKDFEHINRVFHLVPKGFLVYSGIRSRSSRPTGPKTRVPTGSPASLISTAGARLYDLA